MQFFIMREGSHAKLENQFSSICTKKLNIPTSRDDWNLAFLSDFKKQKIEGCSLKNKWLRGIPNLRIITAKTNLFKTLNALRKEKEDEWDFIPRTFVYPIDGMEIRREMRSRKTFIVKRGTLSKGKGIYLANRFDQIDRQKEYLVQDYLQPCLWNGHKFDLRLYVLIHQSNFYLYCRGLVRLCTKAYQPPKPSEFPMKDKDSLLSQLTNFSLHKSGGSKKTLQELWDYLDTAEGACGRDVLWPKIRNIIRKTFHAHVARLKDSYIQRIPQDPEMRSCFDIVGVDIMLDEKCKPYLLGDGIKFPYFHFGNLQIMLRTFALVNTLL